MSEAELLSAVLALAMSLGILAFHSSDSRRDHGRGFPDVVLCGSQMACAELKGPGGYLSPDQVTWKWRLQAAGIPWYLWTPREYEAGEVEQIMWGLVG